MIMEDQLTYINRSVCWLVATVQTSADHYCRRYRHLASTAKLPEVATVSGH